MMVKSTIMQPVDLSVDLGNSMLKGATISASGTVVTTKIANRIQVENPTDKEKYKYITVGNQGVYIGVGKLNNNYAKHTRENLLEQVLWVADSLYPKQDRLSINLKLGLPFDLYDIDKYVEELKSNFETNTWINYSVNGEEKQIYINGIEVFVEGYSAFISLINKLGVKQKVLLLDVGGETTDVCDFTFNFEENEYEVGKAHTVKKGVIGLVNEITKAINEAIGADIQSSTIDTLLRSNQKTVFYGAEDHVIADYVSVIDNTVKGMLSEITNEYGSIDNYYIIGVGGGFDVFNAIANQRIKASIELSSEERFYANVTGYLEQ